MEAIKTELTRLGCTVAPLTQTMPGAVVVGYAGRDVICFLTERTPIMQKFADAWRGVPPVNLRRISDVRELIGRIRNGEFDADSKYEREQIILRLRR